MKNILDTKYPIIQGGMAHIATGAFAAAVSNAGGLGLVGAGGMTTQQLKEEIAICQSLTNKPFGVNIMLMHPQADEMADIVVDMGVKIVTTGAGNPSKHFEKWKAAKITIIPVIASVAMAKRMEQNGADAVVAEGTEAGGHVGEITTMALVPQVVEAVNIPVFAAGGIYSGKGYAAALALGAAGVQLGTVLLATVECPIHENYKKAIIDAKDISTCVTGRSSGAPVRIIKNRMAREYLKLESEGADKMELEKFTLGSLRKAVYEGDASNGSLMAGQVAGGINKLRHIKDVVEDIYYGGLETIKVLQSLGEN